MLQRTITDVFLIFGTLISSITTDSTVKITTKLGEIEGIVVSLDNKLVTQFLKVPYAQTPTGDLRFKKPLPVSRWNGVYNATAYGPSCMQVRPKNQFPFLPTTALSEDCLHLNIYMRGQFYTSDSKAVMIWVHGGGYNVGQAALYDGSYLALTGDVIVITINYRLGIFGFASTGNREAPGNYGLWDQLMAIRWVKENIKAFGGDPNRITIFGESAGAESVSMLSMAPPSEGLFQRVITESGSCLAPAFPYHAGISYIVKIAKYLNCSVPSDDKQRLIECLRNASAEQLLNVTNFQMKSRNYGPVVDGELIPNYPERLLADVSSKSYNLFSSRDVLLGTNSAEGGLYMYYLKEINDRNISDGISTEMLCKNIAPNISEWYFRSNRKIADAICNLYRTNNDIEDQARSVINLYGDTDYVVPTVKLLNKHKTSRRGTYQFLFSQQTRLMNGSPTPPWFKGANHADELGFVFGMMNLNTIRYSGDQSLADMVMSYWTNFAKFGNPNGNGRLHNQTLPLWPSYKTNKSYIELARTTKVHNNLYQKRMDFWLKTVPALGMTDAMHSVFG